MKKLPAITLFLLIPFLGSAQTTARNSLSLSTGPNWIIHKTDFPYSGKFSAKTGFLFGLEYSRLLASNWQVLLGIRHSQWRSTYTTVLQFPSQNPDGSITMAPGETVKVNVTDKAWQAFTGIRWTSSGPVWRLFAEATGGITDYLEPNGGNAPLRFQVRSGGGLEWLPVNSDFQFFALPTVQYIFKEKKSGSPARTAFLIPALEAGARMAF